MSEVNAVTAVGVRRASAPVYEAGAPSSPRTAARELKLLPLSASRSEPAQRAQPFAARLDQARLGSATFLASSRPAALASVPGAPPYADLIDRAARQTGVDRALLAAVVQSESSFNPRAVSKAGAMGLMQLMGPTAKSLGVADAFDPQQNLLGGARYLKGLLDRYGGSVSLALAAYNAGPQAVDRYGGVPPYAETQAYVPRVLAAYKQYQQSSWTQGGAV